MEVLNVDGNYSTFLAAVEKVGMKGELDGKANITLFAPDDDVFTVSFQE